MDKPATDLRQVVPPPAHIARSPEIRTVTALPLTQQLSDPSIRQKVPPSYINPEGITEESSTLFTQAPWPQGKISSERKNIATTSYYRTRRW